MRVLAPVAALGLLLLALVGWWVGSGRRLGPAPWPPAEAPLDASAQEEVGPPPVARTPGRPARVAVTSEKPAARAPGDPDLQGRAVDPAGRPVGGVEVVIRDGGGERTVHTDASGHFRLPGVDGLRELDAHKPGWLLLHLPELRPQEGGAWPHLELVLTPTSTLRIVVEDARGEGLSGVTVSAQVSPAESSGHERSGWRSFRPRRASASSDATGTALLEGVPARQRLLLRVQPADGGTLSAEYQRAGFVLLAGDPGEGIPIVLEPGAVGDLAVVLAGRLRVRGLVLGAGGAPTAAARVALVSLEPEASAPLGVSVGQAVTDEGAFEFLLHSAVPLGRVLVRAQGTEGEERSYSPFGGRKLPDPLWAAWEVLDLAGVADGEREVILALAPMQAIAGSVVDAAGEDVGVRIDLRSQGGELDQRLLPSGTRRSLSRRRPGDFRFAGVPPGLYDVVVSSSERETVELTGVAAGTEDLLVRLEGEPAAQIEIEVVADVALEQVIVLTARLHPHGVLSTGIGSLPAEALYSDPLGWPDAALGLWYGAQGHSDALGEVMFSSRPIQGDSTTLERAPGLYWFGAKARTVDGLYCFPVGTGLVRVDAGDHRLRFELVPAGSLEGRVLAAPAEARLHVALALHDGRLVPLDVRRARRTELIELGADGRFAVGHVPSGVLELRVGTPEQLRAGRWQRRIPLVVRPGETTRVELGP